MKWCAVNHKDFYYYFGDTKEDLIRQLFYFEFRNKTFFYKPKWSKYYPEYQGFTFSEEFSELEKIREIINYLFKDLQSGFGWEIFLNIKNT